MVKDIQYYLDRGFDRKAAEYFSNGRRKIISVQPNSDFSLTFHFDNREIRRLDMSDIIKKNTVFAPLSDFDVFSRVYLDEMHCVSWDIDPTVDSKKVWQNKIDLCPDNCYIDSIPIQ